MNEKKFQTDMNDRERQRFSANLREIAKNATDAAEALEQKDDVRFMVGIVILSLSGGSIKEMTDVLMATAKKPVEEFPSLIDGE